jgi:hypothetical protein
LPSTVSLNNVTEAFFLLRRPQNYGLSGEEIQVLLQRFAFAFYWGLQGPL